MAEISKKYKLNNGLSIPIIGLGTTRMRNLDDAKLKSLRDDGRMKDVEDVVYYSIKYGTRLIDTASKYENEIEVGKGIKKAIEEKIVKREDLFVITKMWIDEKEDPEKALKQSLERLQLSYVDLYLDHWPSVDFKNEKNKFKYIPAKDVWEKMEKLVEKNLTKSIGVSNYNTKNLLNILSFCKIKPVVNEVEFHPYLYQKELKEFCDKENIKIICYYPLIKGVNFKSRFPNIMSEKKLDLLNEEIVLNLAKKYGKTVGQIVLNWHINLGVIPIPGTCNQERMKENLAAINFKMEDQDYDILSSLDKKFRFCDGIGIYGTDIFA